MVHIEYSMMTDNVRGIWNDRIYAILSGSLNLTKKFYEKHAFPDPGFCPFEDLRDAIHSGNKKVFWYLHSIAKKPNTEECDVAEYTGMICKYVLYPLIKLGLNDWLDEFLTQCPDAVKYELRAIYDEELMVRAMGTLNFTAMRILFRMGMDIYPLAFDRAESYFEDRVYRFSSNEEEVEDWMDQFYTGTRAEIVQLHDEYPCRDWYEYNLLIPYYSELDDEGSMIDSDFSETGDL